MPKHKIKKSIASLLTLTLTGTMLTCGAANLVPFNAVKPVVPPAVPVTKTIAESKPSSDGFSVQSIGSKINDIIKPKNAKPKLQATSGTCGDGVTYVLEDGVLTISKSGDGSGSIEDCFFASFANNNDIASVIIEDGVTSIGFSAFEGCSSLTSITIPDSVTFIGYNAFENCGNLGYETYDNAKYLGNTANPHHALITASGTGITSCEINENTKVIAESAFAGCSELESVTIPDSVTSIGGGAFEDCNNLGYETYDNAKYLGNTANPRYALITASGTGITSCEINENTKVIAVSAFAGCSELTSVTIPDSVTSIADMAFSGCSKLKSVTIPDSVTSIGIYAFENSGLTSITIPDSVTSIGFVAFRDCSSLTEVTIPNSVTSIAEAAFACCSSLTSITIPDSVTSIGISAFEKSGLTSITIPDSVTSIGSYAFKDCSGLSSITIPDSVTSIGEEAFCDCSALTSINFLGTTAPNFGGNVFENTAEGLEVHVPTIFDGILENFGQTEGMTATKSIPSGYCGSTQGGADGQNVTWVLDEANNKLIISGTGEMTNDFQAVDSTLDKSQIKSIMLRNGVTIGDTSFDGFSSLEEIKVDADNTAYQVIDGVLFDKEGPSLIKCPAAKTSVTIPSTVTSIEAGAFEGCSKLTAINVADGNANFQSIDGVLFNKAGTGLIKCPETKTSVTIPSTVTSIEAGAFGSCSALTSVRFNGTQDLNLDIFTGCTSLQKINVPGEYESDKFCGIDVIKDYYKITYDVNGGTLADGSPDKYYVTVDTTLKAPSRTSYTFKGWTGSNGDTPQTEVTIPKGSTENKNYVANWKLAGGVIAGIVVGSVAAAAAATVGTILCLKNRQGDVASEVSDQQAVPAESTVPEENIVAV